MQEYALGSNFSEKMKIRYENGVYISVKEKRNTPLSTADNRQPQTLTCRPSCHPLLHNILPDELTYAQLDALFTYLGERYPPDSWQSSEAVQS